MTGRSGNYDSCSFSVRGVGRFRPLAGANPHIGHVGVLEVNEERIETEAEIGDVDVLLESVRQAHPYDVPAIDVLPMFSLTLPPKKI